jgi:transglutaminase-like putative cysteine protease
VAELTVRHRTVYEYALPVRLGPQRLMLRPRESRDLRLCSYALSLAPEAQLTWAQDVFGNAVATATFDGVSDKLTIDSKADLSLNAEPWPIFSIDASAITYPFAYSTADRTNLGALAIYRGLTDNGQVQRWARGFVRGEATDTLSMLKDLSAGVTATVYYDARDEEGTQEPAETLSRGRGSCRDIAALFVETARSLGVGGRVVSGYLYNTSQSSIGSQGPGSTHAWAELYLPGAGWITFDPTNRSLGGANLIPVAVGRDMAEVMPVTGSFAGPVDALQRMSVEVQVQSLQPSARGPLT